jgi:mevalonate kinase
MTASFSAPAKIILFGEHAVVHGQPAIAVPVPSLRAHAGAVPNPESVTPGLRIRAVDLDEVLPVDLESEMVDSALIMTARLVLKSLQAAPPNVTIAVESGIPMASGLGSGAAVSTALARALIGAVGIDVQPERLNQIVYEVEKLYHGTPSGIDNTVVVYEKPVYFVREQPIELLNIAAPLTILIGDTGLSAPTRVAIGDVRRLVEADPDVMLPVLDAVGAISRQARAAIERGDVAALGPLMVDNHRLLQQMTVSSLELDRLVDTAMNAGALGAKLSGGGRGGNMIALVDPARSESVKQALLEAGAVRVFHSTIS